jgi:hypothetical protein
MDSEEEMRNVKNVVVGMQCGSVILYMSDEEAAGLERKFTESATAAGAHDVWRYGCKGTHYTFKSAGILYLKITEREEPTPDHQLTAAEPLP